MEISASGPRLAAFTVELRALTAALDPGADWYAVFAQRSPRELDGWLAGAELPPWDVVADLLQDLAGLRGLDAAAEGEGRLRARYREALREQDAAPGARGALARLGGLLEGTVLGLVEQGHRLAAAERSARRSGHHQEADRLAGLRMWAEDDAERFRSRQAEARARLAELDAAGDAEPAPEAREPAPPPRTGERPRTGGARMAGAAPAAASPAGPEGGGPADGGPAGGGPGGDRSHAGPRARRPRGARFAGLEVEEGPRAAPPRHPRQAEEDRRAVGRLVSAMAALRAGGRSGEVHGTLCEALAGPAHRLPLLLDGMELAGLGAETTSLLWEAAALPPGRLAAVARALSDAGRGPQCGQLLRQGAARPAAEAGVIAAELMSDGHATEAVTLLAALVRARRAEEAIGAAVGAPSVTPLLLDAARRVSPGHHHAVTTELRRAGVA